MSLVLILPLMIILNVGMLNLAAGNLPIRCGGYALPLVVLEREMLFYKFTCYGQRDLDGQIKVDIFHAFSRKPFTKRDCIQTGCTYFAWNTSAVGSYSIIIDAVWYTYDHFVQTAAQLRVCKVPDDHNVHTIVTYTASQLNNPELCATLYTEEDSYRTFRFPITWLTYILPDAKPLTEEYYVYVRSDLMSKGKMKRLNSGETGMVISTSDHTCNQATENCHISIWSSSSAYCYFNFGKHRRDIYHSTMFGRWSKSTAVVHLRKLFHYKIISTHFNNELNKTTLISNTRHIEIKCLDLSHRSTDSPLPSLYGEFTGKHFSFTVKSLYWPNITIAGAEGAKRIGNHFYFSPNQLQGKIYFLVVSTLEDDYFQVNRTDQKLEKGEIFYEKIFHNPINYTSVYSLSFPGLTPHTGKNYSVEVGVRSLKFGTMTSSVAISTTKLLEIEVMVNPMELVAVRGDESGEPSFLCVTIGSPQPTITWSGITTLHATRQVPVNSSLLPEGYVGTYLQFPPATSLTSDYSGDYMCAVYNEHLGTKVVTASFLVLEPGNVYNVFKSHVPEKVVLDDENEEIELSDEDKSFIGQLDSPFITEARILIRRNKHVVATSILGIAVGFFVIISLLIWIGIMVYRRFRKKVPKISSDN